MESLIMSPHKELRILMFPWLAHGHISPYLELAKRLTKKNFIVYLCSTPANFKTVKHKIDESYALSIHIIELKLPTLHDLPPCYHTTNGLPPELMPRLKQAFDMSEPRFSRILTKLKPDLLIYDFLQPWAPMVASRMDIPAVMFITSSSTMNSYMFHSFMKPLVDFPFDSIYYRDYECVHRDNLISSDDRIKRDAYLGVERSSRIVLIKGFKEIEARYSDYLSSLLGKKIMPVGALVQDPKSDHGGSEIISWLDKKEKNSTVFVSFGSEYFLKKEDIEELALGLEKSAANFIWVIRFPKGESVTLQEALPLGFLERVGDRGLVLLDWAPQAKILRHGSIGGFVSHCGCSSMFESMRFGVPIIAMPMHLDQPLNARLVHEIGVGLEVVRNSMGQLESDEVANVIRRVLTNDGVSNPVCLKAKIMSEKIERKGDEEIDEVAKEFVMLCGFTKKKKMKKMMFTGFVGKVLEDPVAVKMRTHPNA